jgi:sugar transferase EpsL
MQPCLAGYIHEQARQHEVRPDSAGWAQVNGRNALTWEEKFGLDVWYVNHLSFGLDMEIVAMTVWKIVKREGISQSGQATMSEFRGSHNSVPSGEEGAMGYQRQQEVT